MRAEAGRSAGDERCLAAEIEWLHTRLLNERRSRRKQALSAQRTPWDLVGLLVLAGMVAAFHVGKAPPALPAIRADLDASLRQAGWLLSIVNLVTAAGGMAIALTADRLGDRKLILFGTALCLATSLLGGTAGSVD